jgi:hypothetical protein
MATVTVGVQHPFVTSFSESRDGKRTPGIEVMETGNDFLVVPTVIDESTVRLRIQWNSSEIESVDTVDLPVMGVAAKLQAPTLVTNRVATHLVVSTDQTLLLAKLAPDANGIHEVQLLALRVSVSDLPSSQTTIFASQPAKVVPSGMVKLASFPRPTQTQDSLKSSVVPLPRAMQQRLSIHGAEVRATNLASLRSDETAGTVEIAGEGIEFASAADGKNPTAGFAIRSSEMRIKMVDEQFQVRCDNAATISISDDVTILADQITWVQSTDTADESERLMVTLDARGNVRFQSGDKVVTADRIHIVNDQRFFEGNVEMSVITENGDTRRIGSAERVQMDSRLRVISLKAQRLEMRHANARTTEN